MISKVNRGDVFIYNFGNSYSSSVESKERPALVVSNNKGNTFGTTCLIAPITTRPRQKTENNPWQVFFKNGDREQAILLEQIRCVSINKLGNYVGHLDDYTMHNVNIALCIELDLPISNQIIEESKMAYNMYNGISANINSKLVNLDKFEKSIDDKLKNYMSEIISKVSNIKVNNEHNSFFEDKIDNSLEYIKSSFNQYTQNVTNTLNVLINMYDRINEISLYDKINEMSLPDTEFKNNKIISEDDSILETSNNVDNTSSETIKGIKISSTADMISFLDYYMTHSFEEIENKYHFDKKSAMNRKSNYIKRLNKFNIDTSKYLVYKPRIKNK